MRIKHIAIFLGTRPEAIKMAPIVRALKKAEGLEPLVISTGQHREMLRQVLETFNISVHYDLDLMSHDQSLAQLSARLLTSIDSLLAKNRVDFALVQGDTTTALMAALACFYSRIPVGHVEAGLRTGNLNSPFPEEANRQLVTPLACLHFAPTEWAANNIRKESVEENRIFVTGNTVIDALLLAKKKIEQDSALQKEFARTFAFLNSKKRLLLVTGHRRESFGGGFEAICEALRRIAQKHSDVEILYPVHLNPNVHEPVNRLLNGISNIYLIEPVKYLPFVYLMMRSFLILTDSGGIQEEAPSLGKPVLVLRNTTERPEAVEAGTVMLVGADTDRIVQATHALLTDKCVYKAMSKAHNPYGDGFACQRIVRTLQGIIKEKEYSS